MTEEHDKIILNKIISQKNCREILCGQDKCPLFNYCRKSIHISDITRVNQANRMLVLKEILEK